MACRKTPHGDRPGQEQHQGQRGQQFPRIHLSRSGDAGRSLVRGRKALLGFTPVGAATALPALVCGWLPPPQRIFRKGFAPFGAGADSGNQGSFAGSERADGRLQGLGLVLRRCPKAVCVWFSGRKPLGSAQRGRFMVWNGWPPCVPARGFFFLSDGLVRRNRAEGLGRGVLICGLLTAAPP